MVSGSPASSIQTRTLLGSSPRQVPMAHNLRFRKENLQIPEKVNESRFLLSGHGVARLALLIEPSLIADADRASIIRSGMSPHLQQLTVLRHRTVLTDVEVVADVIKPTSLMVTAQLFHTIVLIASASRAMQYQKSHRVGRHHVLAVLLFGEKHALRAYLPPANVHWKRIFRHRNNSTFNTQHCYKALAHELTPSAVRAAISACTMAFTI